MTGPVPVPPGSPLSATDALLETQAMLAAIGRIQAQLLTRKDTQAAFDELLSELLRVSASRYGFIGEVLHDDHGQPFLRIHAITDIAWNEATRRLVDRYRSGGLEFRRLDTLIGEVLRTGETVISNAPHADPRRGGLPEGHPPLDAFMGIPFLHGEALTGMVGLANRPGGYSTEVLEMLQPVLGTVRTAVVAHRSERARARAESAAIRLNRELRASVEELERLDRDNRALSAMRDELQGCQSVAEIAGVAERFSVAVLGCSCGMLCLQDDAQDALRVAHRWGRPMEPCCTDPGAPPPCGMDCVSLPLTALGEPLGLLRLFLADHPAPPPAGAAEARRRERLASALAMPLALAIANVRMRDRLREQAMRDPLTGLFNRRHMDEVLERECRRAARRDLGMVVFVVDIDQFKRINDGFGHQAGDQVIREVARCLESAVRREDYAFRYGGDEFVLLLADTGADAMGARAECILQAVRRLRPAWKGAQPGLVTVSIGAAAFPVHGRTPAALLQAADAALYLAKQAGRDCAVQSAVPEHGTA